jgi:glycosyltransferase involved in cell wall biosynthesis
VKPKTALVVVLSQAHNDPRVRRQLSWLADDGWTIDTIGLGPIPSPEVRQHFALADQAPWLRTRLGALLAYRFVPRRTMFRLLASDRIPLEGRERIAAGEYSLVVFNDIDFIPLVKDRRVFTRAARRAHIHLDIHEYRDSKLRFTWGRQITRRYYTYVRDLIGSDAFTTRSTVADRIADFYADDFGIERPVIVRNSPPFHDQQPSEVNDDSIRLVFHGMASWARGFRDILDAMSVLDDRFTMTFMLTGNPATIRSLQEAARGFGDRVQVVPPVPMSELSETVNQYDLEIMFYQPTSRNLEFALPNKFFEAIQGRLGLIVGESPMMAELVREYQIGAVVPGWSARDLAETIAALTAEQVRQFKKNSNRAANDLNAEVEGLKFIAAVNGRP